MYVTTAHEMYAGLLGYWTDKHYFMDKGYSELA